MSSTLRNLILALAVGCCLVAAANGQEVVETWEGGGGGSPYAIHPSPALTQRFTVPAGKSGVAVEMWVQKHGSWYQYPGYYTHIAVYAEGSYATPIAARSYQWTDPYWVDATGAYLSVSESPLNLAPGVYYVQIWSNTAIANERTFARLQTGSTYPGGEARAGWAPGTPLGENMDFRARVTLAPQAKPLTVAPLGWYDDRWGDQHTHPDQAERVAACLERAAAIADTGAHTVLPYLSGVDFLTYSDHIFAVGRERMKMLFEFNRWDVVYNVNGISPYLTTYKSNWAVDGWYLYDEPMLRNIPPANLEAAYEIIDANNTKPVFIAFAGPEIADGAAVIYQNAYDVMMINNYPFAPGQAEFANIDSWKHWIALTRAASETVGKPWWSITQAMGADWRDYAPTGWRLPTYDEERFMVYWSILEGATGVMLWSYTPALDSIAQPEAPYPHSGQQWIEDVAQPIGQEYRGCAAAIAGGAVDGAVVVDNSEIVANVYKSAVGEYVLIAANPTASPQSGTFTLNIPQSPPDTLRAVESGLQASVTDISTGTLTAGFDAYAVRVYRLMPAEQVIETYAGTSHFWKIYADMDESTAAVQWFEVPPGTVGAKFEFFVEIGGAPRTPDYHVFVQIFQPDGTFVASGSMTASQFPVGQNSAWVPVENLQLSPGRYYAQMFTNQPGFRGYLHTRRVSDSGYGDGFADKGWNGGALALDAQDDFMARLTVTPAPVVQGTVTLQDYVGDITTMPVIMKLSDPDTGAVLETHSVMLDAAGAYGFVPVSAAGEYYLSAQAAHWLRQRQAVTVPGVADFSLVNGDITGANQIDMADMMLLSGNFLQTDVVGNPADVNGDGNVDLLDFSIIAANWNQQGDDE